MELANTRYLKFSNRPEKLSFSNWKGRVPKYKEAQKLNSVIVDDLLNVNTDPENLKLLNDYLENDFSLVPIRRKTVKAHSRTDASESFPQRVLLELTSLCNLDCVMCPRTVLDRPVQNISKKNAYKCIDEFDAQGIQGLWLYNIGESMLHPDFAEILNYAGSKKNLGSLWLSTNGQQLKEENLKSIMNSKLTFLNFSLNAMDSDSYVKISPRGRYDDMRVNLERLFIEKESQGKMGQTPWLRIQMIDQPQISHDDIDNFFEQFGTRTEIVGINKLEAFSQDVAQNNTYATTRHRTEFKRCNRLNRGDCFVFSDGEVGFCDTDFNHKMSLGNIAYSTIRTLWNGPERQKVVALNESGKLDNLDMCRNCLDYDL